jgi:hypothetical protein
MTHKGSQGRDVVLAKERKLLLPKPQDAGNNLHPTGEKVKFKDIN